VTANGVIAILIVASACGSFAWLWFTRDRTAEVEVGPVVFSDDVWVRVLRGRPYGIVRARLLVGSGVIATRARGLPHWLARLMRMDYTLLASEFEVGLAPVSRRVRLASRASVRSSRYPVEWDNAVVLSGADGRGWLELELFRSRTARREDVQQALIGAGARPADE
jgi:hypothetical protein